MLSRLLREGMLGNLDEEELTRITQLLTRAEARQGAGIRPQQSEVHDDHSGDSDEDQSVSEEEYEQFDRYYQGGTGIIEDYDDYSGSDYEDYEGEELYSDYNRYEDEDDVDYLSGGDDVGVVQMHRYQSHDIDWD
ncbi:hypothetical protein MP228_007229 [Amoeboaphelidium protococcarum]|nr:hypothetical protein MP228_007229 [Amoeboaphelidium protococcarum]